MCSTGYGTEADHKDLKKTVERANNELNDYYTSQGQLHSLYSSGAYLNWHLAYIQKYQPQHYIVAAHGSPTPFKGSTMHLGTSSEKNWLDSADLRDTIQNAGKTGIDHAMAPMSAIIYMTCYAGEDSPIKYNYADFWNKEAYAWIFVANTGSVSIKAQQKFIYKYSDGVTDKKWPYKKAIKYGYFSAVFRSPLTKFGLAIFDLHKGPLHHATINDRYRNIDRVEQGEGSTLSKNGVQPLYYYRSFHGTTNGAYVVFHAMLRDNSPSWQDTGPNLWAEVKIKVEKEVGDDIYQFIDEDTYIIDHTKFDVSGTTKWGGSDICTLYISANTMKQIQVGVVRITVTLQDWGSELQSIYINRFEIMEIGSL